jgi:hypothetical protein
MELKEYFESTKGFGVLSTADGEGRVNAAVYSRPHVMEDGSLAFIMRDRLTHSNIQANPHAIFLFREDSSGYKGKRLYLTKTSEEQDTDRLHALRRRPPSDDDKEDVPRFLVFFRLDNELPLVGAGD